MIVHVNAAPSYATGVLPLVNETLVVVPVVTVNVVSGELEDPRM